jgi:hypothetical protein
MMGGYGTPARVGKGKGGEGKGWGIGNRTSLVSGDVILDGRWMFNLIAGSKFLPDLD